MFQCRMSLHRRAYNVLFLFSPDSSHRSNRIIDIMIIEALRSAEQNGFGIETKVVSASLADAARNRKTLGSLSQPRRLYPCDRLLGSGRVAFRL